MNRIDRLTAILIHLQGKKMVVAQELANRFGISLRTVYRDIRALEEAGVPIGAEAGKGYFLSEGYHLPPVMFTNEEAGALLLGAKLVEKMSDESVKTVFDSALYKIRSVLKAAGQNYLSDLEERIAVTVLSHPVTNPYLTVIQKAIVAKQVLHLTYQSAYSSERTLRKIEPFGLYHYGNSWHLIAYCRLRRDYRDFRVDRIEHLSATQESFESHDLPSLQEYIKQVVQALELTKAVVKFDKKILPYVQSQRATQGFTSEEELPTQVRMVFWVYGLEGFARWLLSYTHYVEIEEPLALKETIQNKVRELQAHYLPQETIPVGE